MNEPVESTSECIQNSGQFFLRCACIQLNLGFKQQKISSTSDLVLFFGA
jgi:hypothetical protein